MTIAAKAPGLYFTAVRPPAEPSPLRSDIAGFIGRTRRGPVGVPVRVEGWRGYLRTFGDLAADAVSTYAIRGYFDNDGEIAWIIRLGGYPDDQAMRSSVAGAIWDITLQSDGRQWSDVPPAAFLFRKYRIEASSPGAWANGTRVIINYRRDGMAGRVSDVNLPSNAEIDLIVRSPGEPVEYLSAISLDTLNSPGDLEREIAAGSRLIRITPIEPVGAINLDAPDPRELLWELVLSDGRDADPGIPVTREILKREYLDATISMGDVPEAAIIAVPGLADDVPDAIGRAEILTELIGQAERLRDRIVLVDAPNDAADARSAIRKPEDVIDWTGRVRGDLAGEESRAAAFYHPRLIVSDPLGGIRRPQRAVPPSGHVAGVISRLDRQRGAHQTPANAPIYEVVDVAQRFDPAAQARFNESGANLLRCFPGNGIQVWGGRTLNLDPQRRFIAHRRLVHRLVRAIRRVAEPLVFEINGPEMWLTLTRSITAVLLEAWRAGSLKGARPDEAFRVQCDEKLNPPEEIDLGRVNCEIEFAPAVPMEFIHLRVSLSGDGKLEVFES